MERRPRKEGEGTGQGGRRDGEQERREGSGVRVKGGAGEWGGRRAPNT